MTGHLPNDKAISRLGFGASSVWAKAAFADGRARTIVDTVLASGINHFDTGPSYGAGLAETRLGRFLATADRDALVVSTKVGTFRNANGKVYRDFSRAAIERSLTESLARLGCAHVDILYLHGAFPKDMTDDVLRWFDDEKARGRITYSGLNSFDPVSIRATLPLPIDVVMLQHNVVDLSALPLFDDLVARGKTIIAATVLAQGVTSLKTFVPRSWPQLWYLARALRADPKFMIRGRRLAARLARHGLTRPEDMTRFALADPRITSGLFGTSNPAHVVANAAAAAEPLDPASYFRLAAELGDRG